MYSTVRLLVPRKVSSVRLQIRPFLLTTLRLRLHHSSLFPWSSSCPKLAAAQLSNRCTVTARAIHVCPPHSTLSSLLHTIGRRRLPCIFSKLSSVLHLGLFHSLVCSSAAWHVSMPPGNGGFRTLGAFFQFMYARRKSRPLLLLLLHAISRQKKYYQTFQISCSL